MKTIKKTRFPTWKESFDIPLIQAVNADKKMAVREGLEITIWDWDRLSHNDFMGQVHYGLKLYEITIWDWDRLSHNDFMGQVNYGLKLYKSPFGIGTDSPIMISWAR